ncbi:MAG TPA: dipeptidase [Longimicrobiales bacterium]|jgi:membrane dipeptidase
MFRRPLAIPLAGLLVLVSACSEPPMEESPPAETPAQLEARARAIHDAVITIDTHDDIPGNFATSEVDPLDDDRQVTIEKMEAGGLDVAFFVVYMGQGERTAAGYANARAGAIEKFEAIHRMADDMYPDRIEIPYSADDVERIQREGKLVAAIGIENGYVIGRDISLMEDFYNRGARYMGLTHNGDNDIGDSNAPREQLGDDSTDDGLTEFGERVVAEMNRLGFMLDVSHASRQSMLDAVRLSRAPVIASHSSARALADHTRNLDDEQLLALRDNGGVMQTVAFASYVKVQPEARRDAQMAIREELGMGGRGGGGGGQGAAADMTDAERARQDSVMALYRERMAELDRQYPPATVSDVVDHIDYAVRLIGVDHVGISSDFDGGGGVVGWNDASETFNVTHELVRRGYTEEDIRKLWGGNLLRVWREVERVAAEIQGGAGEN